MAPPRMGLDPGQSYEYDDEKTYEEAVAAAVEAQYEPVPAAPAPVQQAQGDIGITEYDQGPSIETYAPADTYFDATPAEPTTGAGFTDMGPQVQAYTPGSAYFDEPPPTQQSNVITAEDWFTTDNQQRLFDEGVAQHVGPMPTLGDGTGWFSEDDAAREQQAQWWQAEVDRAVQAGDQEKVDALLAERDRVLSAYDQYATDVEDWKTRYQDYEGQFNANLEAALTFDPRGEGGFSRTSSGELISNLDQQGWMDQLGTPQIVNPFTDEPQSMTDWQREAEIRDALYQMDAEQAGNFPTRFAPAAPEMTFEQYVMERQRQFAGDPDAQAWFSGFGAGAYGAAPDDFRVVNLLDRVLNTDISLPYGSGTRPAEAQEYRNQGVTPLSIFGGAADVVGGAVGLGARGAGAALGTAWDLLNADLPIADMSVIDALNVAGDKTYGRYKEDMARRLVTGTQKNADLTEEEVQQRVDGMVARWEQQHPILDIAGSMIIDPLNLIPGGLLAEGTKLAKLKTANVLLKDVLTAEEAAQIAERGVTMRDLWRLGRSEARINTFLVGQGVGTLPRDRLATAFTRRLVYRAEIGMSRGEDLSRILGEERAGLVDLAKRMGVDERDASRLENIVTRYERQINEALALGPGDTMVGYRSVNAANAGKADSPFHEVWDATETTFKRLDREAEDLIPVSDAGFIDPEPLPPSLKQKKFAQDLFHEEGITQADLRRILNDEVTDTEAYQIIGRAKNTATVGQAKTAWKMYDEGRLTMGEFARIVNKKTPRDQVRRILAHAGTREPRQLVDRGLVKVGSNNPAWRSQADRAWDEVNWRDNSAKFLDNTLPRIETHINPQIRAKRYAQTAEIDAGRVAPPGLIIDALQRAKVAGQFAGTKWDGWLTRMLDDFIPYTKVDGTISSDTVQWLFKTMRDDIIDAVKHGDMPIDDVRLMNRLIRDVNSGSKLDEAVAAVEAAAKRQNDLRGVEKVDLDVRALKQENEALRARIEAGKRAGEDTKSLSRQMATNTGRIKKYDSEYVSPRAPRKTAAQKVAEQDEKLKAQGIERPPSSDPSVGEGFTAPKDDASNDILGRLTDNLNNPPGIVDPRSSWLYDWGAHQVGKIGRKTIDPMADVWHRVDWTDQKFGQAFDDYMRSIYEPDSGWRKWTNNALAWGELQKGAKVAKTGDLGSMVVHQLLDSWNAAATKSGDPLQFVVDNLSVISDPMRKADDLAAINPFFTNSKEGGEWVKAFRHKMDDGRTTGQHLIERIQSGEFDSQPSIGWFNDILHISAANGKMNKGSLDKIDAMFRQKRRLRGQSASDWHRVQQMQTIGKDAWQTFKRENFNKAGKLEWGDVSVDDLSNRLFPMRQADAQDLGKMAESIGGALSELDAVRLGYDFTKVDPFMWLMQTVKGNLSPLWMTMNPGYHIRNISGNTSAQMVAAMRSDMHVSPSLRKNELWARVAAAEGSASHPWLTESLVGGTTADVAQEMTKNAKRFPIAAALEKTPGLKQWKKAGEVVADTTENFSKQLIYSHEWGYSYTDLWTKRLGAIDLDDAQRAQLLQQATYAELTKTLDDLGITGAKRAQIIGANKEAKAWANVKAYKTASEALRDYRMRNRLDFVLDRIVPVHYWTTRNAMFVGRSLLDRPQAAAVAMGGFNAWEEQNKDLPPSMRWGLLPIPGNLVSWIPGVNVNPDDTFYLRAGTFVNPAVFAIPKLLDPGRWDLSSTSLPDRLDSYGALGLKNMWEAMGYQVGPQWDLILDQVGARSGNKSLAGFASWLASPSDYYTRQDRRSIRDDAPGKGYGAWLSSFSGYGPDGLPLLGSMGIVSDTNIAALIRAGGRAIGKDADISAILEKGNQIVYGTPYTRMETAQMVTAAADQWQKGEINEAQYWAITWAITNGNFEPGEQDVRDFIDLYNDPNLSSEKVEEAFKRIRPLVNGVTDAQAAGYLLSALGIGGKTDTPTAQNKRKQQNQWVEMRDWSDEQVATFLKQNSANETYTNLYYKDGRAIANAWMKENAPWLPGYWIAYDSKDEFLRQFSEERRYNVKETADAAAVALYQGREDIRTAQTPYYVRLNKAQDARDKAMAKAGDNMILRDIAQTIYSDTASQIYDEAAENGVDMTGLGRLPRHSPEWYQGLPQDRQRFLEANGATEDLEELRTTQEQRGHILDKVAERLNVTRYVTDESGHRVLNPAYGGEDEWDEDAFQAALKEAADVAPAVYQEIASQYRDFKKMGFDSGITVGALLPVTPADFIQHTGPDDPELAAWREEKYAAWGKIQEMPKETKEERAAQYDAKQAFFNEWGEFPASGSKVKGPSGYTYGEKDGDLYDALTDAAYGEKVQTVDDWYWNQLTPRQRKELESEYPDAFTEVDRQGDDGGTYKGTDFDPKRLTGDQLSRIIYSNNIQMVGVVEAFPRSGGIPDRRPEGEYEARQRVQKINDLNEQYDAVLTEDDQAALDLYYGVRNDPRYQEARAYAESHKTKNGKLGWYAAKDAGYADIVEAYFSALDGASPVFDKQEAWVNGLPEEDRNLLIEEYPSRFGRYGEDRANGTSSGSSSSTTGSSAGSSSSSGSASSGKSGSRSSGSSYSRSSSSGGSSSRSSSRSSGSGFWSGGSSNRSSGSGGGTGSVGQPSADDFVSVLTNLDPFLAEGNDDGRGEIVSQISTRLARQFGPILLMMPANRRTMIQSMLLRWVTMTLGNNPSLESWQKVLAELTKNDKPDQQQAATPVTLPVPLTAGY